MVIAHLFLFCPSFQRLWSLRKSLKIHFYSSQSVTVTFCFQLRNCNTSPYNNHSQVGKVLGTSTSELCEGKRISWKYPQKTNKQTNQKNKVSSNLDLNWQFFLFKNRVYFLRSARPMRTNHFHPQMYFRREEVQYVKLLFSSNQPSKFLYTSFHFWYFFLNVNPLAPHGRHGGREV